MLKVNLFFFALVTLIVGRLIPHPPNFTPVIVLSLLLSRECKFIFALSGILFASLISDGLISILQGFPWLGDWTIYTYSAMAIIILTSKFFEKFGFYSSFNATLFYWVWTNFGVWLSSGMYPHSMIGLSDCFIAALPFLGYSLAGTIAWYFVIFKQLNYFSAKVQLTKI